LATAPYGNYKWIVRDPDLLGGKLAIRGTRLSVSFVLACLAEGMSAEEITQTYAPIPQDAICGDHEGRIDRIIPAPDHMIE